MKNFIQIPIEGPAPVNGRALKADSKKSTIIKVFLVAAAIIPGLLMAQAPAIISFSPASGAIGSSVTITGTGFNTTANQNIVIFGATQALVAGASINSLSVTVPIGASYENISVTNLSVNLTAYSAKPFAVTFSGGIAFANKVDFSCGVQPYGLFFADFDGDNKSDIVIGNGGSNSISVFRNTSVSGTVNFAPKIDFTTVNAPQSPRIGDMDGDGKPDVVVNNWHGNMVSVFRNTSSMGTINFATRLDFSTGVNPAKVNIGDFDGDGKPDVVVENYSSNTVSVFRNTSTVGNISFATRQDFSTGLSPCSADIVDVDGDGKPDMIVSNRASNTASVFRNTSTTGSVSFAAKVDFATGNNPYDADIGDIDGDGKPDFVVTNYLANTISVLRNTSTIGTINFAGKVDFATGTNPTTVRITDLDGDGKADLSVSNNNTNNLFSILRNTSSTGGLSFEGKVDFAANAYMHNINVGDVDGDGKPDVATASQAANSLSIMRQLDMPQGSLIANGPFCVSGTGLLTWSATAGQGPFTLVYNDGVANRTVTNVSSGVPFNTFINPVNVNTTYSLVSVSYPNNALRTNGFTQPTATIDIYSAPTFTSSSGLIVSTDVGLCTATVSYSSFSVTGVPAPTFSYTFSGATTGSGSGTGAGSTFNMGVTIISHTATNACGSSTDSFSISVTDTTIPSITAPVNFSTSSNSGCTATGVAIGTPTTGDNCSVAGVVNDAPVIFPLGNTIVTWTVTDGSNNQTMATQTVTVIDNTSPTIAAPSNYTTTTNAGCTATGVTIGTPTTGDNCSVAGVINDAPLIFPLGNTIVTWTVTDGNNNQAMVSQTVFVSDNISPTITAPANYSTTTNAGCTATGVTIGTPTTGDNCSVAGVVNDAPVIFPLGNTIVTWTVTDGNNNQTMATQTVTVIDNISPTIAAPLNYSTTTNAGCTATGVTIGTPTTGDNCSVAGVLNDAPLIFPLGNTIVTWTVTDGNNNPAMASQTIFVSDNISPTISAPANYSTTTNAGCTATGVTIGTPTTGDNCSVAGVINDAPLIFPLGNTIVTWTVTDGSNNQTMATQTVTVIDNTSPTIAAPSNYTTTTNAGCTATGVTIGTPTTGDNCSVAGVINDAPLIFPLGNTIVTWTVTDGNNNQAMVSQTVFVSDNISPTITAPANYSTTTNAGCTATGVTIGTPTAGDNCSVAGLLNDAPVIFPLGNTIVTWTVTDGNNNQAMASQTVFVSDNISPTITAPANYSTTTNAGCTATGVTIGTPTTGDNCSVAGVINDAPLIFPLGNTIVTWTVSDGNNNPAMASQTIFVSDNISPTISAPANYSTTTNAGCTATGVTIGTPTTGDNCSVAGVINDAPLIFPLGNTIVTWTVTDGNNNQTMATQTVTVIDNISPTIAAPLNYSTTTNAGCTATGVTIGTPTTGDNCLVVGVLNDAPLIFPLGSTIVTWTVTDGSNNQTMATQTVLVIDNINPTITAPSNYTTTANAGCTATGVTIGTPTTGDNCSVAGVINNAPVIFPLGNTIVTWTVTDGSNNQTMATQTVVVIDNINPTLTAPSNYTTTTNAGCTATGVTIGTPTTGDNCSVAGVINDAPVIFPLGNTIVTWTITDGSNNQSMATQTVTVIDTIKPTITGPLSAVYCSGELIVLGSPTTSDNCSIASLTNNASGTFPIGSTIVTWIVTDSGANTASSTQTITVKPLPDITTNSNGAIITSNQNGASYQWLDCNSNNSPITGATNQSYTVTANGNYAVAVNLNSCEDTSACVYVNIAGINSAENSNNQLGVYPNPNSGLFTIKSAREGVYSIRNELGQVVHRIHLNAENNYTANIENLSNGLYFIIGINDGLITNQKVVVNE